MHDCYRKYQRNEHAGILPFFAMAARGADRECRYPAVFAGNHNRRAARVLGAILWHDCARLCRTLAAGRLQTSKLSWRENIGHGRTTEARS